MSFFRTTNCCTKGQLIFTDIAELHFFSSYNKLVADSFTQCYSTLQLGSSCSQDNKTELPNLVEKYSFQYSEMSAQIPASTKMWNCPVLTEPLFQVPYYCNVTYEEQLYKKGNPGQMCPEVQNGYHWLHKKD